MARFSDYAIPVIPVKIQGILVSPTQSELDLLDKEVSILADRIDSLCGRLSPVTTPQPPRADGAVCGGQPEAALCPVANQVRSHRYRVAGAAASLAELIDRLEV